MNKYSLKFRNKQIENQYQAHQQKSLRARSFKIVTLGFTISLILRILTSIIIKDYTFFEYNIGMLIYVLLQYIIIRWKPQYTRIGFVLINFSNLAYNMENNSQTNLEIAYFKGQNAMAINFLIILAGEFPECVIVFTLQTMYRLARILIFGQVINWTVFCSIILINMACFIYFYYYFKAKRSQYLLSLVDNCWDNILKELITDPFILLKFDCDNLKFTIEKVKDLSFLKNNNPDYRNLWVRKFLRNAKVQKQTVEEYIFSLIKQFSQISQDSFSQTIFSRYDSKNFQIEISIFQASHPTILLKIKSTPQQSLQTMKKYKQRFIQYNQFIIRFLKGLQQNYHVNYVKRIRRKLIQIQLLNQILCDYFIRRNINFSKIMTNLQNMYPEKILIIKDDENSNFISIPNIFVLLLMKLLDNAHSTEIVIEIAKNKDGTQLFLQGDFDIIKINYFMKKLKNPIHSIIEKYIIKSQKIYFQLFFEPYLSYDKKFIQQAYLSKHQLN